ncbi:MAG: acyltransferase family protein [Acutalibacteraceae bacterium]
MSKTLATKRNGKIEFLRFIFCMSVLLFHFNQYIMDKLSFSNKGKITFFSHGAIAVEFFFFVSGYLMAKSIFKRIDTPCNSRELSKDYVSFIYHKYMSVFPQNAVAFVITCVAFLLYEFNKKSSVLLYIFSAIPNFLMIDITGIRYRRPNGVNWYISAMLIAMMIIYPLCKKFYYTFTRYFAPLSAILILGWLTYTQSNLTSPHTWLGLCFTGLIRAIAEISLGTTCFEISRYIQSIDLDKGKRILLTLLEIGTFAIICLYIVSDLSKKYDAMIAMLLFVLVFLAFSGVSYGSGLFNNKLCYFLGKTSLPIYLSHSAAIYIVRNNMADSRTLVKLAAVLAFTAIISVFVYFGGMILSKLFSSGSAKTTK